MELTSSECILYVFLCYSGRLLLLLLLIVHFPSHYSYHTADDCLVDYSTVITKHSLSKSYRSKLIIYFIPYTSLLCRQSVTLSAQHFSLLLSMGLQFYMAKGHTLTVGLFADRTWKKNSNLPNGLKYCVIFIVYTQFTNVAAGRCLETHVLMCVMLRHVSTALYMYKITNTQTYNP